MKINLVLIDRHPSKERLRHLYKAVKPSEQYPRGRAPMSDLLELDQWMKRDNYAPVGQQWKERFSGGTHVVGTGSEITTILAPGMSAVGVDLTEIQAGITSGVYKKPRKASRLSSLIASAFWGTPEK